MKLFIADNKFKGTTKEGYNWCDDSEILMFGQFQLGNGNPSEISMCGIKTRKFTTHIIVKDLDIPLIFLHELIIDSVEMAMYTEVDPEGWYEVDLGFGQPFRYNIETVAKELINKAAKFEDGDTVTCFGRTLKVADTEKRKEKHSKQ